ncbi:MAG TPA: hypothetical protein VMS99_11810 [Acidimicrobiia bacterium]|nr:hypothetical protein [Acidimicrobiia bacterium]
MLRQSYGLHEVRSYLGVGRRRRGEKPASAGLTLEDESGDEVRDVPLAEHPLIWNVPLLDYASFLTGQEDPNGIRVRGSHHFTLGPDPAGLYELYGLVRSRGRRRQRAYDHDFGRMLAKIAWAGWVSEFDVDSM